MRMNAGQMGKLTNTGNNTPKTALIVYMWVSKVAELMVAVCDQIARLPGTSNILFQLSNECMDNSLRLTQSNEILN